MRPEVQPLCFWLKICAINWGKTEEMVCASAVLSLNPSLSACGLCEHVLPALQSYSLQLYTRVLFLDTDTHMGLVLEHLWAAHIISFPY